MEPRGQAIKISRNEYHSGEFSIANKKVILKNMFTITENEVNKAIEFLKTKKK